MVKSSIYPIEEKKIHVLIEHPFTNSKKKLELINILKNNFGDNLNIDYAIFGSKKSSLAEEYESLLSILNSLGDINVVLSYANFFGEGAEKFNTYLRNVDSFKNNRLYFLNENNLAEKGFQNDFITISNVFFPKTVFLNTETISLITLIGRAKPNSKLKVNIQILSGNNYLNSKDFEIDVPESGLIRQVVEVPAQFSKLGNQIVNVQLSSTPAIAFSPLNSAFTTIDVTYSKTTVLHIAYSPDWNLRLFRWKLKFWPNLDLLSYYILRDMTSDQSIRNSELSLIEFPSQKLFGTEIQNLHGIIAQNFIFGEFLGEQESRNLVQYVKNGGRLVLASGSSSFSDWNKTILELFPCENKPLFETDKTFHWVSNEEKFSLPQKSKEMFNHIISHSSFTKCIPKENAIVLARAKETNEPVLIAMPLYKGIVMTFLSSDWLSGYTSTDLNLSENKFSRLDEANASDSLFQWMVEFLQRKQDSGIRPPEFLGPRVYSEDRFIAVKSNGGLNLKQKLLVQNSVGSSISSTSFVFPHLRLEMLQLDEPLGSIVNFSGNEEFNLAQLTLNPKSENEKLLKYKSIPIFFGNGKILENKSNPFLFQGAISLTPQSLLLENNSKSNHFLTKDSPLLLKYPWLLALALALLALEQLITRVLL